MGKNLFILAILTMGLMACSTKEDVADEREPLKPETPVEKDEWETILPDGGVIERDDITIQFPKGTFSSETKVAVSEVKKGQILGEEEVSKFYQITLPYSCAKEFKVKIKCDKNGDDINAVVHAPSMAIGPYKKKYSDITLESTYSNGEYTFTIPASSNEGVSDNANLSVGIAKRNRIAGESAGTRAVGGISWHYDIGTFHQQKYLANWTKADYPGTIKSALQHLQDLGFKIDGTRNLPVSFEVMDEGTSGYLDQDGWNDIWNGIVLNDRYITDFDNYNAKYPVKRTCIHELLHYYQSHYDPRWPSVKMATDGDERMIYECAAVWSEKFNDGGSPSLDFVSQYLPRFLTSLTEVKKAHEDDKESKNYYADHGYGMAALIEYLTTQRKSEGIDNNSVVELYEIMKSSSAKIGFSLSGTTFDFLKSWVKKHNSTFFENDGYDDFILKLMTGKVYTEIKPSQAVNGSTNQLKTDGEVSFNGTCYPYGGYICRTQLLANGEEDQFKEKGSLTNKQLVIEQNQDGVKTYVVAQYQGGLMQIDGKATKGSPIIIDGKTLESFRKNENYNVNFYTISTNSNNQSTLPTEVKVELKDMEETDIKITNVNSVYFFCHLNSKIKRNNMDLSTNLGFYSDYYKDANFTISQSKEAVHVESSHKTQESGDKGEKHESQMYISFDITGFTDNLAKCKIENFTYTYSSELVYPNDWDYDISRDIDNIKCTLTDIPASEVNLLPNVWTEDGIKSMGILSFDGKGEKAFKVMEFEHTDTMYDKKGNPITDEYELTPAADDEIEFSFTFYYTSKKK